MARPSSCVRETCFIPARFKIHVLLIEMAGSKESSCSLPVGEVLKQPYTAKTEVCITYLGYAPCKL